MKTYQPIPGRVVAMAIGLWCMVLTTHSAAHEVVGKVTPLMIHMKKALLLIESGEDRQAVQQIRLVYDDFSHDMGMGMVMEGTGLAKTAAGIDRRFGTSLGPDLTEALSREDVRRLHSAIESMAYLLMLEKFDALVASFEGKRANHQSEKTVYWLGRNYFSYLLEPTLALRDPIEGKRLDRLLDSMLYRLEDGEYPEFNRLRRELEEGIMRDFKIELEPRSQ